MVGGSIYCDVETLSFGSMYCICIYTYNFVTSQYLRVEEL